MPEKLLREEGYTGEYTFGSRFLSKEPLAIVTRGNDAEFLDLCNWVINSLFAAEAMGITQEQAWKFPSTNVFGGDYRYLFKNVIATIGNYGEFTERHFEFQRQEMNQLASGNSGLLYVHPFGTIELEDASKVVITPKGTMEDVEGAQHIRCGVVVNRPGFASSSALQGYSGMDIDFCRALSVAMFSADGQTIEYVEVASSGEGFQALAEREIDIFAGAPFNMENDVLQPTTGQGFSFSPPYFYGEPDAFGSPTLALALATREEDPQWSDFVRWVVWCTMYAEEAGLSSDDVGHMPLVDLFGVKYSRMFRYVILELGNYADIYARNMGSVIPRSGANKLNDGLSPLMNPWTGAFQRG